MATGAARSGSASALLRCVAVGPRLALVLCALLLMGQVPQLGGQELVADGEFAAHPRKVTQGSFMADFPGFTTTALAVLPGDSAVSVLSAANAQSQSGWYRVQFFAHALHGYSTSLTVDVLDDGGTRLAPPFAIRLRAPRNEWLHYDEFVPCNPSDTSAAQLTIPSSGSTIQLTGLSVTWQSFASRGLVPVSWLASGTQPGCPISGSTTVECPNDHGESSLSHKAFDNDYDTGWFIAAQVPTGSGEYPTMALELQFDSPAVVCGVRVVFDAAKYPRSWRVLAKEGSGDSPAQWTTWIDARDSWPSGMSDSIAAGIPPLETSGDVPVGRYFVYELGLACTRVHRVRLEIEDPADRTFYKTQEIELLTRGNTESSCECRHGGALASSSTRLRAYMRVLGHADVTAA